MPVVSRPQRTEAIQAKYNVVVEFPHLGLHSAAATGNLGLVKYALDHGQPINSVLDGVLPLHAACSGGNDLVVRLLIEKGADVNAPRLPRRYSSDKNRDTSAPIIGASGSTPLHFACANGHSAVVMTLLLHGARPDRADKHGMIPEMLARKNGWIVCADIVQQWVHHKDRDLREKDALDPHSGTPSRDDQHTNCPPECRTCSSKRLRVKKSLDTALNRLKPSLSQSSTTTQTESEAASSYSLDTTVDSIVRHHTLEPIVASPLLASDAVGEALVADDNQSARCPSLPNVLEPNQTLPISRRQQTPQSSSRRPRSAGTDADQSPQAPKLRGKVSLLSMFKKVPDSIGTPESRASSASITPFMSPSPSPSQSVSATPPSHDVSSFDEGQSTRFRGRLFSEGESCRVLPPSLSSELHRTMSGERLRPRPSPLADVSVTESGTSTSPLSSRSASRPGILRPHNRSVSSGQSQMESHRAGSMGLPSVRALRFNSPNSASTNMLQMDDTRRQASHSPVRSLRVEQSYQSIRSVVTADSPRSPLRNAQELDTSNSDQQVAGEPDRSRSPVVDEEEEYGVPVVPLIGISDLDTRLNALKVGDTSNRQSIISVQSSSPLPSPGGVVESTGFDCPFSINNPPPEEPDSPIRAQFLGTHGIENRLRGDSMSSMSTTGTSGFLTTPAMQTAQLPSPYISSETSTPPEIPAFDHGDRRRIQRTFSAMSANEMGSKPASKGSHTPFDIDIRSISSHAQAEALVQRTQKSILEMQDIEITSQPIVEGAGLGRTPLSAKLAAYGESLALERKLKQEEEQQLRSSSVTRSPTRAVHPTQRSQDIAAKSGLGERVSGLDRKYSLEERSDHNRTIRQSRIRRPHTSGGTCSSDVLSAPTGDSSVPTFVDRAPALSSQSAVNVASDSVHQRDISSSMTPPRSSHLKIPPEAFLSDRKPSFTRARTPDPGVDLSSSIGSTGVPLSRVSTAPAQDYHLRAGRVLTQQERRAARKDKLTKMGLPPVDPWQGPGSASPSQQYASKHRLGGFKGFVQSLSMRNK